ncbi:MAG: hypothetical protein AAGB10_00855 [Pseudomonadota bacterium]
MARFMERLSLFRASAMALLIGCFVASAAVRMALIGPALAEQITSNPGGVSTYDGCSPGSEELLETLRVRGETLDQRERDLAERVALLELAETEIQEKRAALAEAEESLASTIALADGAAERDLAQLTTIYENVKPKRAAEIFETMEASFATGILSRMAPAAAAEVMALMTPEKAYSVSLLMAARNVNAGGTPVQNSASGN